MSDATDQDLPPLGTPTRLAPDSARIRRQLVIAAAVALIVGLAAGFGLATALDGDGGSEALHPPPGDTPAASTVPATTGDSLPEECVATVRSAQQTLELLDQGLRDLRNLNLGGVDTAVNEVQRLRGTLDQEIRRCAERIGD